ncbi:MAG TPA: stringent starvation protein SspA [Gammaproteobacteria bacterium]|nr:stringent starvation protein SspA [Gammaproteobacteria bacterium]
MTAVRRSVMTLYSGDLDLHSHRVRIVLAEKDVTVDILSVSNHQLPEDLVHLNPYNTLPTLVDRDLVLYHSSIIMEYLDERFPHPPLLPVYPVARAKSRLMMYRIEQDWYSLAERIESNNKKDADTARKELQESLIRLAPVFNDAPYFLSDEFTLVDCCIAPLLWRLPKLGINLLPKAKSVANYAKRMFKRDSFQISLTEAERELRATSDDLK